MIPWEEHIAKAHAFVTHSSTASAMAVFDGIPIFITNRASIAAPVASFDLSEIEAPYLPDRKQWADNLAYCQWSKEEMADGKCWAHIGRDFASD